MDVRVTHDQSFRGGCLIAPSIAKPRPPTGTASSSSGATASALPHYELRDRERAGPDPERRAQLHDFAPVPSRPLPDGLQLGDLRVRLVEAELGSYLETGSGEPADIA